MPLSEKSVTVTLRRSQWEVILAAASSYDSRVPTEQGDGGACLDTIRQALTVPECPLCGISPPPAEVNYCNDQFCPYDEMGG